MPDPVTAAALLIIVTYICFIDFDRFIIPDWLNATLFAAGVLVRSFEGWREVSVAILVAGIATLSFWLLREVHRRMSARVGLGLGDVKLIGASTVWISGWNLPFFMFLASFCAISYFALRFGFRRSDIRTLRIPFGPFLGIALIMTWGLEHTGSLNLAP